VFVDTFMAEYEPSSGVAQVGASAHTRPVVTFDVVPSLPVQVTVGGVIGVPTVPVAGTAPQESVYVTGAAPTVNVPPQEAAGLPAQFPAVVVTFIVEYVVASTGLAQVGASAHTRPVVTFDVVPSLPVQVTVGGVISVPTVPVVGTSPQESVYVTGAAPTVNVPPQVAVLLAQSPAVVDTVTPVY
jgi:hypothetical protein